jgi:glycosyltransferase involved in cell wall biosynthesis
MVVDWLTMGGSGKFNLDLLRQLTERGWEVTIATTLSGDHSWAPLFGRYTPDIFILHHFLRLVDYPRFLRYLIQSRQVDAVLISHSELGYLLLPYLRAHFSKVTFVDFCHIEEEHWKNGGYPRLAVEYQESLDLNFVTSEHLKGWMVQRGADTERIRVRYINIDSNKWRSDPGLRSAVRPELGLDDVVPVILYAGRICLQKQPRVFARTMLQLRQQGSSFVALVAGDGPDMEWLRSFIKEHKLSDQIRLLGMVSIERMKQLMSASDIFFLPSQWEGIALSVYEAMACGLPVVGADVGGQRELVAPECGVLIRRSDENTEAQRYVQGLGDLLRDPQCRRAMGQAGRARVSAHFRLEEMGERMVALLEEARDLRSTNPRPQPSLGLARACAAQAVEYIRLYYLADRLWNERYSSSQMGGDHNRMSWRVRVYLALDRWHKPFYRMFVRRGWPWPYSLTSKIKQVLLRAGVNLRIIHPN